VGKSRTISATPATQAVLAQDAQIPRDPPLHSAAVKQQVAIRRVHPFAMAPIDAPADSLAELAFELEHFEWTADDRLEVTGRWFGVRGRRFVRPTLHVRVEGRRRRLIAVLDHKPWAADTEALWTAAFTWSGDHAGVTGARLEVSPDVILDLPNPGAKAAGTSIAPRPRPRREPRKPPPAPRKPPTPAEAPPPAADEKPATPPPDAAKTPAKPPPAVAETTAKPPPAAAKPPAPPSSAPAADLPASSPPTTAAPAGEVEVAPVEVVPVAAVEQPPVEAPPPPEVVPPAEIEARPTVAPVAEIEPPSPAPAVTPPAHAPSSVAAEIAVLALERRLVEERAERQALERELAQARQEIEALSAHHASAVERAREIVELEGQLAVANARADAAQARVAKLESELGAARAKGASAAELEDALAEAREELAEARTPIEVAPLAPRTPPRRKAQGWDRRTQLAVVGAVGFALVALAILVFALA
jgi:hypothetical protein